MKTNYCKELSGLIKPLYSFYRIYYLTCIAILGLDTSVYFTWTDNSGTGKAAPTDKAVLVAYSELSKQTLFSTTTAQRSAGAATLDVTNFKGSTIQT